MKKSKTLSRYERVKLILDNAQGEDCPEYDGHHRFWEQPHADFIATKLYGIPLFVLTPSTSSNNPTPQSTSPCCSTTEDKPTETANKTSSCCDDTPKTAGQGDAEASGLIKGLKGQFPFDGSQFPPLLWNAENLVAHTDIQFIADWITAGCPETDAPAQANADQRMALACGAATHQVTPGCTNQRRRSKGHVAQRKNVEELNPEELAAYRNALRVVRNRPEIDRRSFKYWGRVHGNSCEHGWEKFLPWHRCQMYEMEQLLLDVDADVALHYWQWSNDTYYDPKTKDYHIPKAYQLWITEEVITALIEAGLSAKYGDQLRKVAGEDQRFQTVDDLCYAAFYDSLGTEYYTAIRPTAEQKKEGHVDVRKTLYEALQNVNPMWYPFRYPMKTDYSDNKDRYSKQQQDNMKTLLDFHHHYPTSKDIEQILAVSSWRQFGGGDNWNESFGVLDMDPHNTIHIWSGGFNPNFDPDNPDDPLDPPLGDMLNNLTAGFDPIFYAHHSNVDRLWWKWQVEHPGMNPDDGNSVLVPFNYLVRETYNIQRFGYEYVRSGHYVAADNSLELSKFKSEPLGVSQTSLENFSQAEIKIMNVVQSNQSLIVKVFLNLKNPDPKDRDEYADHYVGSFVMFGHGKCIGSEGHCDPPPKVARQGDIRQRHHNTPGNYRFNATDCVRKLIKQGATDFHVNLLVQDTDGRNLKDRLRIEALSLDFLD